MGGGILNIFASDIMFSVLGSAVLYIIYIRKEYIFETENELLNNFRYRVKAETLR